MIPPRPTRKTMNLNLDPMLHAWATSLGPNRSRSVELILQYVKDRPALLAKIVEDKK